MNSCSFFEDGEAIDPAYVNIRDHQPFMKIRQYIENLWTTYAPYADPHFRSEAKNQFFPRFWEMYLTCGLLRNGLEIHRVSNAGPEYYFLVNKRRVWVEAIAPSAGFGDDRVDDLEFGKVSEVQEEKILLRFTHSLLEKNRKYKLDLAEGRVKSDDAVILAIYSGQIPNVQYGTSEYLPYFVKAFFPIGDLQFMVDTMTYKLGEPSYTSRTSISKKSGALISTDSFLNSEYSHFSAVLHSSFLGTTPSQSDYEIPDPGLDFSVLHNPKSLLQIPQEIFSWCRQFHLVENKINISIPN